MTQEVSNATDDFDDEDKVMYNQIGKTEIHIDKILANLLDDDNYQTVRNIVFNDGKTSIE